MALFSSPFTIVGHSKTKTKTKKKNQKEKEKKKGLFRCFGNSFESRWDSFCDTFEIVGCAFKMMNAETNCYDLELAFLFLPGHFVNILLVICFKMLRIPARIFI